MGRITDIDEFLGGDSDACCKSSEEAEVSTAEKEDYKVEL